MYQDHGCDEVISFDACPKVAAAEEALLCRSNEYLSAHTSLLRVEGTSKDFCDHSLHNWGS